MNRLKEIKELKALAEELQLENREIIRKYNMRELCSIEREIHRIQQSVQDQWLHSGESKLQLVESAPLHRHESCPQIREHLPAVRLGRLVFSLRVCRVQKEKR